MVAEMIKDNRVVARKLENIESLGELEEALRNAFDLIDLRDELSVVSSAVIKPNVCWEEDWKTGGTTCPQLVEALVSILREIGVERVTLAEGSMVGVNTIDSLTKVGFADLAKNLNLEIVDLNEDETVKMDVPDHHVFEKIEIARTIVDSEYFINMPVMKTHINTLVTLSMKNLKGTIPQKWKKRLHYMGLDGGIADLASAISPDLIVMDGLVGQEGMGPLTGTPAHAKVLMISRDQFAIDVAATMAMGFDPSEVKHLSMYAAQHGVDINLFRPVLVGSSLSDLNLEFEKPHYALEGAYEGVEILWGDPCSGCAGALSVALERMEKAGELDDIRRGGGMTIALGKHANPQENDRLILVGRCQHKNRNMGIFIPGCPPPGMIVRDIILKLNNAQSKYGGDAFIKEAEELYKNEEE